MRSIGRQYVIPVLFATATILISFLIVLVGFLSYSDMYVNEKVIVLTTPAQYRTIEPGEFVKQSENDISNKDVFSIGNGARVYGTGNDGLRIRSNAGLESDILFLIKESAQVQLQDGPVLMDGMIWWKVQTQQGSGWTVQNYLEIIE